LVGQLFIVAVLGGFLHIFRGSRSSAAVARCAPSILSWLSRETTPARLLLCAGRERQEPS
jgi:hypothetical protein